MLMNARDEHPNSRKTKGWQIQIPNLNKIIERSERLFRRCGFCNMQRAVYRIYFYCPN